MASVNAKGTRRMMEDAPMQPGSYPDAQPIENCDPTLFGVARDISMMLTKARNNLSSVRDRISTRPTGGADKPCEPACLSAWLEECRALASDILAESASLSGVVGE